MRIVVPAMVVSVAAAAAFLGEAKPTHTASATQPAPPPTADAPVQEPVVQPGPAGAFTGSVRVVGLRLRTTGLRSEKDVVIWLQPERPQTLEISTPAQVTLDQREMTFVPHVVVVPAGGSVVALNNDTMPHNVHSLGKRNDDLNISQRHGEKRHLTFEHPEVVRVVCDFHPGMEAFIVVVDSPYYIRCEIHEQTQRAEFTIAPVPPGRYKLNVWNKNKKLRHDPATITIDAGKTTTADIEFRVKR